MRRGTARFASCAVVLLMLSLAFDVQAVPSPQETGAHHGLFDSPPGSFQDIDFLPSQDDSATVANLSGKDWHPDWQTTDLLAPTSAMAPLLPISPATFTVSWSGSDNGPAGLRDYDIQVREDNGPWMDWQLGTTATSLPYTGVGGHTYAFRCRARDNVFNLEPYRDLPDAATTVEDWPPPTPRWRSSPPTTAGHSSGSPGAAPTPAVRASPSTMCSTAISPVAVGSTGKRA